MQLRRSPGGSMLKFLRSRPLDPPSSVTVTTAARSLMQVGASPGMPVPSAEGAYRLRPRNSVDSPVPPPMATTLSPLRSMERDVGGFAITERSIGQCIGMRAGTASRERSGGFGIEKFGEARIVRHVVEVRVAAGLDAVLRIHFDGLMEMVETFL